MFERQVKVSMDPSGISAAYPNGKAQALAWADVGCIAIETNDSGPWGADVWWVFEGADRRCAYPQGATGEDEVLKGHSASLDSISSTWPKPWQAHLTPASSAGTARMRSNKRFHATHQRRFASLVFPGSLRSLGAREPRR
jgi:hypothetical protein